MSILQTAASLTSGAEVLELLAALAAAGTAAVYWLVGGKSE